MSVLAPSYGVSLKWIVKTGKMVRRGEKIAKFIVSRDDECIKYLHSPVTGTVKNIYFADGGAFHEGSILADIQICDHPALFGEICVSCGERPLNNNTRMDIEKKWDNKITVGKGHTIRLSDNEAMHMQTSKALGLLEMKKFALILDLDHTLVHATSILPNQQEIDLNILRSLDIFSFQDGVGSYWIKLRPGTLEFLKQADQYCQLWVYTHGTRKYAESVVSILDPDRKLFKNRVVSRTDVADLGSDKSLKRLFVNDASMALIVDDRSDVWRGTPEHLMLVRPYFFFDNADKILEDNKAIEAHENEAASPGVDEKDATSNILVAEPSGIVGVFFFFCLSCILPTSRNL